MILAAAVLTMASCKLKDEPVYDNFRLSTALSIFVNDEGKVGVSSLVNENYNSFTEYWVNGEKVKLKNGNYKTRKISTVDWNEQDKAEQWRKAWADITKKYLEENNLHFKEL